ncbi:MAG: hydrogenase [Candidatus Omnitrophota bacterium]
MQTLILFLILISTYLMTSAKRVPALVRSFQYQSFGLFLATLIEAAREGSPGLYAIAALVFILKVSLIPRVLLAVARKIKANEDLGLLINPQLSLFMALTLTYVSWIFAGQLVSSGGEGKTMLAIAFFVVLAGLFLMIFRMTALAQVIGLCVMENGLFLLAASISGGMPFFVEIAIFFDVLVSVLIMGFFVYRINRLFTHIDVDKLTRLKG